MTNPTPMAAAVVLHGLPRPAADERILAAIEAAALAATDFAWLKPGDTVLLKPAGNSKNPYPAVTSPLAVRAMTRLLKARGAGRVILCDKSGVESVYRDAHKARGSTRRCFQKNGLHQAATEAGAETLYFEETPYDSYFQDFPPPRSHWKSGVWLPAIVRQADHLILLPRVSRHVLAGSTLGLKSGVGWLRDDSRLELHRDADSFFAKCAEIHHLPALRTRLRLTLSLATKVLTSFGPDFGPVVEPDPGLVIASASLEAHDMAALSWLLWCREHLAGRLSKTALFDPYRATPGWMNRFFVGMIWGPGEMWRGKHYRPIVIGSVNDDPVLARAFEILGAVPRPEPRVIEGSVPALLLDQLSAYWQPQQKAA